MERKLQDVRKSLISKRILLAKANYYELLARQKRELVKNDESFFENIIALQEEASVLSDEFQRLNGTLYEIVKHYESTYAEQFPEFIPWDFYNSFSFGEIGLKSIGDQLAGIALRLSEIYQLLSDICEALGHRYLYIRTDDVFDFDSLELAFTPQDIFYCTCCGKTKFEEPDFKEKDKADSITIDRLKLIRSLGKYLGYHLPFNIVGCPNEQNALK